MLLLLNVPDNAARHFGETPEAVSRNLLLKASLEDYREGRISEGRFAEILDISRWEAQEILDKYEARRRAGKPVLHACHQSVRVAW